MNFICVNLRLKDLTLHQQPHWVTEELAQPPGEAGSIRAVDDSVIVRERERQHEPDFDFAIAHDRLER